MRLPGARIVLECSEAGRRRSHLRPARRRRAADLRRAVRLRGAAPHPGPPGGGGRPRGGGVRARDREGRRVPGHLRAGLHESRDRAAGRHDGFDPHRRVHRAGPDPPDRQRRLPGGRQRRHHPLGDQAQLPGQGRQGPGPDHPRGVPHRGDRPPRSGARRSAQGHPGQGDGAHLAREGHDALLQPELRRPPGPDQAGGPRAGARQAAGALRGRRRDLGRRQRRTAGAGRADADPGHHHADGPGGIPVRAPAVAGDARHARDLLRELRRAPLRRAGLGRARASTTG